MNYKTYNTLLVVGVVAGVLAWCGGVALILNTTGLSLGTQQIIALTLGWPAGIAAYLTISEFWR